MWQQLFGRGLVYTSENFGIRADRLSHPELLDWLALEFMQNGWSIKSILQQIVLSQTYQQSSQARPELSDVDPSNRLLARQARLRFVGRGSARLGASRQRAIEPRARGPQCEAAATGERFAGGF
ncbi:MAG: DUF1553 domain-containing protein [Pirellulaceae bacterium]